MPFDHAGFSENIEILEVLMAAKQRISTPELWCKNTLYDGGRVCVQGALMVSVGINLTPRGYGKLPVKFWKSLNILEKSLPFGDHCGSGSSAVYNNNPTTTHADIMAWFDRAITDLSQSKI